MDGSPFPIDKSHPDNSLSGTDYDDPVLNNALKHWRRERTATELSPKRRRITRQIIEQLRQPYIDCQCGCRGLNHIDPAARQMLLDLMARLTWPRREPPLPDFGRQFRV